MQRLFILVAIPVFISFIGCGAKRPLSVPEEQGSNWSGGDTPPPPVDPKDKETTPLPSPTFSSQFDIPGVDNLVVFDPPSPRLYDRTIAQAVTYCSPAVGQLKAIISLHNPHPVPVTVAIRGMLSYVIAPSTPKTDESIHVYEIPAAGTQLFILSSTAAGYGCHGIMKFYGQVLSFAPLEVSGTVSTLMANTTGGFRTETSYFTVGGGLPDVAPPTNRVVSFTATSTYCNSPVSYLQGQLLLYNPFPEDTVVQIDGYLEYADAAGSMRRENLVTTVTVPARGIVFKNAISTRVGYGCNGIARFSGTLTLPSDHTMIYGSGNFLSTSTIGGGALEYKNVPFPINGGDAL